MKPNEYFLQAQEIKGLVDKLARIAVKENRRDLRVVEAVGLLTVAVLVVGQVIAEQGDTSE